MIFKGFLLKESLKDPSVLDSLTITRTETMPCPENMKADYMPDTWTGIHFEGESALGEATAEILSKALKPRGWFCDMNTDRDAWLIFPGKVVTFSKILGVKRQPWPEEAREAARQAGVPAFVK
jgi:hypothetical protein